MAADALDKPIDGSISVNRDLTSLALLRLITAAGHGRDDLLREMAERVAAEAPSFDHAVTVFLGDCVDRGLGSMHVVEQLAGGEDE